MKRALLLALTFVLFFSTPVAANNKKVYENHQYQFHMTFPATWQIRESKYAVFEADAPGANLTIAVFLAPSNGAPVNYKVSFTKRDEEKLLQALPAFEVIDKRHVNIANYDALQVLLFSDKRYNINYLFTIKDYYVLIVALGRINNFVQEQQSIDQIASTLTFLNGNK